MTPDSQQANISTLCPNNATCPFIADAGDGNYLVIGATATPEHAAQHGGNVGDGETAVLVPKDVIDDVVAGPLHARIAELTKQRDFAIDANQKLIASCQRADEQRDQARDIVRVLHRWVGTPAARELARNHLAWDALPDWLTENGDPK